MNNEQLFTTSDKVYCPYLLAMSINGYLQFIKSRREGDKVYFEFTPKNVATQIIEEMEMKRDSPIPAKDLFNAINYFWRKVSGE